MLCIVLCFVYMQIKIGIGENQFLMKILNPYYWALKSSKIIGLIFRWEL